MYGIIIFLALITALVHPSTSSPLQSANAATIARQSLSKRAEPDLGDDLPDIIPHPKQLDQVETAFKDALELAAYVLKEFDDDETIFPNYFDEADRANIRKVYEAIGGTPAEPDGDLPGNDLLSNILVQITDTEDKCDSQTLAYTNDGDTEEPYIVLCPSAFKKKAVNPLNGAPNPSTNPADADYYLTCQDTVANSDGHVSYRMNSLGATLLHEYMHYDTLIYDIFSESIIDQPGGYGPGGVYNNLEKNLAKLNAASYVYYASEVLWSTRCGASFEAPRPGVDEDDPDCEETICQG